MANDKPILNLSLVSDADIILARRRARQVALVLGFDAREQTRIATAVSEVARNAFSYGKNGKVIFALAGSDPQVLKITVSDSGQVTADAVAEDFAKVALKNAKRLMDTFVHEKSDTSTIVKMERAMAHRLQPFTPAELEQMVKALVKLAHETPWDEIHVQNQDLIRALDDLAAQQRELNSLNAELQTKNHALMALNTQVSDMNQQLEIRVHQRTQELEEVNQYLRSARDEAVAANDLKTQFVANISHELRTPMSGILGLSELLIHHQSEQDRDEMLRHIHQSARNLMRVVDDLLDFSKLQGSFQENKESFYVSSLFDEVIQPVFSSISRKGLKMTEQIDESVRGEMVADVHHIRRVLQSLVHNAVKFTAEGEILLSATAQPGNGKDSIRFEVKDTGIGLSDSQLTRIFEPFIQADGSKTRKYGGTGLGLSISKNIVESLGGSIGCDSLEGQGSTFWFVVPAVYRNSSSESKD